MIRVQKRAFTLIEILVVVVILGVLSAIVVPQFSSATDEATSRGTYDQLAKIRNAIAVYYLREGNVYPDISAGDGTWGSLLTAPGYLREVPVNLWVSRGAPGRTIIIGNADDPGYQTTHGWIWDPTEGTLRAGSFQIVNGEDVHYERP